MHQIWHIATLLLFSLVETSNGLPDFLFPAPGDDTSNPIFTIGSRITIRWIGQAGYNNYLELRPAGATKPSIRIGGFFEYWKSSYDWDIEESDFKDFSPDQEVFELFLIEFSGPVNGGTTTSHAFVIAQRPDSVSSGAQEPTEQPSTTLETVVSTVQDSSEAQQSTVQPPSEVDTSMSSPSPPTTHTSTPEPVVTSTTSNYPATSQSDSSGSEGAPSKLSTVTPTATNGPSAVAASASGLSDGAKIGIGVGAAIGFIVLATVAFVLFFFKRSTVAQNLPPQGPGVHEARFSELHGDALPNPPYELEGTKEVWAPR